MSPESKGYVANRPRNQHRKHRIVSIVLVILAVLMLLADRQRDSLLAKGRLSADDPSAKVMGVIAMPVRGLESVVLSIQDRLGAAKENRELKEKIKRLEAVQAEMLDLKMRLNSYESMLSVAPVEHAAKNRFLVRSINESNGPFVHSALIDAGADRHIKPGYAVLAPEGLYGHVVRVGRTSARVLLLTDLSSRISVMSQRSQSRAIMTGNNLNKPELVFVSADADWQTGDRVVTSGDGGVLPQGLPVGVVRQRKNRKLEVDLFSTGRPIDWLWVYPFDPIPAPEDDPTPAETNDVKHEQQQEEGEKL